MCIRDRYGGDEFIIIYEYKTEDEVFSMADSLRERILDRRIEHVCSKALPVVTISQGICFDAVSYTHLMRSARNPAFSISAGSAPGIAFTWM